MTPAIDVVIVNWNTGTLLRDCVSSIAAADAGRGLTRTIVVDNASSDGSADLPGELLPSLVMIRNDENVGFAAACNQGAALGSARYVLFLNPDTTIGAPVLDYLIPFMDAAEHQHIGLCGIQLRDATGAVSRSCSYHPTPGRMIAALVGLDRVLPGVFRPHFMSGWDHSDSRSVDQVIGAFYLVRRSLFDALHGFDERFFVYYEEVDFARRAAERGAVTWFTGDVAAYHLGGGSSDKVRAFRSFLVAQSRVLYAFKHFPRALAIAHAVGALTVEPMLRALVLAASGRIDESRESLHAARMLWRGWMPLLRGREVPGTRPVRRAVSSV
jgi:hypothetical protein